MEDNWVPWGKPEDWLPDVAKIPHSLDKSGIEIPHSPDSSGIEIPHSLNPQAIQRRFWMRTEEYLSHGIRYYRFRWGYGSHSLGYTHIGGGSTSCSQVKTRRSEIDRAIAQGRSLLEILCILRQYSSAKPGRKRF